MIASKVFKIMEPTVSFYYLNKSIRFLLSEEEV